MARNIKSQLKDKAGKFACFYVPLNESIDVSNTSQVLLFIRGLNANFEISDELASVPSMHGTTTGMDIFREVEKSVDGYSLQFKNLKRITADDDRNTCGAKRSLVEHINKTAEHSGSLKLAALYCILHYRVKSID